MNNALGKISTKDFFIAGGFPAMVLFLRTIIMSFISRQRAFEYVNTVDTSAAIQIALSLIAFLVSIIYVRRDSVIRNLILHTPLKWFLIYTIWAGVTALWSVNGLMSAYRAFECLAWFLLITALIARLYENLEPGQLIRWILYFAVFTIVFNTLNRSRQFGVSIFSFDTLRLEQMSSTTYFFLALLLPVGWVVKAIIIPISVFSLSNTAYAGMAGGLLTMITGKGRLKKAFILISIIILTVISIIGTEELLQNTIFYGKGGVGIEYTSGRDKIFDSAVRKALERPVFGFGFVSGETEVVTKLRRGAIGSHNGLLSAQLGTGLIGAAFFTIFLISMIITSGSKYYPESFKSAFLATAILISVHTLGNPGLGSRVYGTWIPAMLVFTMICMLYLHYNYYSTNEDNLGDT